MGCAKRNSSGFGLKFFDPLTNTSKVPQHAIGTMGRPEFIAKIIPPFLNGLMLPSNERVPSGKIRMERVFFASDFLACYMDSRAFL